MVKKNQLIISIVGTILLLLLCSAKGLGQGKESYRQAYTRLVRMLEGKDSLDFKKAVFLTENAYFDNSLNYDVYNDQITALATICRRVGDQPKFKDVANNVQYNWAVHQFITDTLDFTLDGDTIRKLPYRYDTLDPSGQKDIINTFLLKLLQTGTGNCRSLTYLYKILADELGAESFFTLAPYHIYIQHFDPPNRYHERRSYNLELTNGSFPRDGWIIAGSYITWTAIRNGMYGVRLNAKQNIALCLSDLGVSYERKFGTDDFLIKLYQTARKYHPENAQNRVRLAESYRKIGKVSSADSLCATLVLEGYREMPDRMYDLWRTEVRKDKDALHSDTSRTYEAPKDPFGNPMPTLSRGKFKEDADQTDSTRVGSVVVDCQTGKVIRYLKEARVYDVSRFLSIDPLSSKFPELTPYQFASNTPIRFIDLDGLEGVDAMGQMLNQLKNMWDNAPSYIWQSWTKIAVQSAENVQQTVETSLDVLSFVPGAETGSDIAATVYYGGKYAFTKNKADLAQAVISLGSILVPIPGTGAARQAVKHADEAAEPVKRLYRAVSPAEYKDIVEKRGFAPAPFGTSSLEGKLFAEDLQGAIYQGLTNEKGQFHIVSVDVPQSQLNKMNKEQLDTPGMNDTYTYGLILPGDKRELHEIYEEFNKSYKDIKLLKVDGSKVQKSNK